MRTGTSDFKSERHALDYFRKQDGDVTIDDIRAKVKDGEIRIGFPGHKPGFVFTWDADGRGQLEDREEQAPVYGLMARPRPYQCQLAECLHIHDVNTNHTAPVSSQCPKCYWHGGFGTSGQYYSAQNKYRRHIYVGPLPTEADMNPHASGKK